MRKVDSLSSEAMAVVLYLTRQRLRLGQHIPFSELKDALKYGNDPLAAALDECVRGGWLLVARLPRGEPHYSIMPVGRRPCAGSPLI